MIRDYKLEDNSEIQHFLQKNSVKMKWGEAADFTLLAEENDELQGLASCWRNSLHPHRAYLEFFVQEENRRQGLAKSFFKELQADCSLRDFQVFLSSSQTEAQAFVESLGFKKARCCYTPVVSQKDLINQLHSKSNFTRFLDASPEQKEATFALQFQNYCTCHERVNAVNPGLCLNYFQEMIQKGLDEKHSYLLLEAGEVLAYVLSYKTDQPDCLEFGYVGGEETADRNDYLSFYQAVVLEVFKDFNQILLEMDDVDPFAMQLASLFNFSREISYDTYIFDKK